MQQINTNFTSPLGAWGGLFEMQQINTNFTNIY
jgi:hypothetical protein